MLYVHMKESCVRSLGPGKRFGLWVQGCSRRCPGCTAPASWDMRHGTPIPEEALGVEIALSGADGLTISGGEPFLQAPALCRMIDVVRRRRDMGVIIYTGFTLEELQMNASARPLLERCDLIIDGPYIRALDDGLSLRGSSNQRVIPLTGRYAGDLSLYGAPGRPHEVFRRGAYTHYVGVKNHLEAIHEEKQI